MVRRKYLPRQVKFTHIGREADPSGRPASEEKSDALVPDSFLQFGQAATASVCVCIHDPRLDNAAIQSQNISSLYLVSHCCHSLSGCTHCRCDSAGNEAG
jgi:hypothetical protein